MKNCTPLWREAHFEVKLWRCRNIALRCGAKHIWKSKCTKHTTVRALLEVEMFKSVRGCGATHISKSKCTNMFGALLEFRMWFCVAGARILHPAKSEQNVRVLQQFQKRWQAWDI